MGMSPQPRDPVEPLPPAFLPLFALTVCLIFNNWFVPLAIMWGLVIISAPSYIVYCWMRDNAYTHTDEWRQQKLRVWIMKELPSPCKIVGHEYEGGKCTWCDALDPNPNGLSVEEFFEWGRGQVINSQKVPPHQIDNATLQACDCHKPLVSLL